MSLVEVNKIVAGKYISKDVKIKSRMTQCDVDSFRELLTINEIFVAGMKGTESASEYFEMFELLDRVIDNDLKEDLFYTLKLGYFYEGVPSKLVYLLYKASLRYDTPNNLLSAIDVRYIKSYERGFGNDIIIKTVLENILKTPIELLSDYRKIVKFNDCFEVYVANTDRVLVMPAEMQDFVKSKEDVDSIEYVKNVGVCVQGIPLRTCGGKLGITLNEYDLRKCC